MAENEKKELKDTNTFLKLNKPFEYEGEMIEGIDFSKLNDFTMEDLETINSQYYLMGGSGKGIIETDILWVKLAVQRASGYSLEMLKKLNISDAVRLKNKVAGFFYILV